MLSESFFGTDCYCMFLKFQISDEDENTREIEETPSEELLVKTSDKEGDKKQ